MTRPRFFAILSLTRPCKANRLQGMKFDCYYSFKGGDVWLTYIVFDDEGKIVRVSNHNLGIKEKGPNESAPCMDVL